MVGTSFFKRNYKHHKKDVRFIIPYFPLFIISCACVLWQKHLGTPFDLPEAEGELVAGYIVE
jgi:NADH:ubiquinone oxidoreductase subunit H